MRHDAAPRPDRIRKVARLITGLEIVENLAVSRPAEAIQHRTSDRGYRA